MKWIVAILILIILGLQYRLWFGEGSLEQITELEREIEKQKIENAALEERNRLLISRIAELKHGTEGLEEKARQDMGMVKDGETFYFITETPDKNKAPFDSAQGANKSVQGANKSVQGANKPVQGTDTP